MAAEMGLNVVGARGSVSSGKEVGGNMGIPSMGIVVGDELSFPKKVGN